MISHRTKEENEEEEPKAIFLKSMLKRVAFSLAEQLSSTERNSLARQLEPALDATQSALARAKAELEALQLAKKNLEEALSKAQRECENAKKDAEKWKQESAILQASTLEAEKAKVQREKEKRHPIYGQLLHDFGYKKVYASEPKRLTDKVVLPVWEKQRIFRPERAKIIAKFKENDSRFGFPGVITVFDLDAPGKRGIVDGQHRIGGLELLLSNNSWKQDDLILTEVYTVQDHLKDVGDLFLEINQAQPMLEIDMPGTATENIKAPINEVGEILLQEYPEMFKPSVRCRPPHLNVDTLRQELFQSDKARRILSNVSSDDPEAGTKALLEWLRDANVKLSKRTDEEWLSSSMVRVKRDEAILKALEKCRKNDFFLGLDESWL